METLRETVALGPNHISAYCLTYEEDTEFFRRFQTGEFRQNSNEDAEFFAATMDFLGEHGFAQYEISNYAQPERDCLHNLAYLQVSDFRSSSARWLSSSLWDESKESHNWQRCAVSSNNTSN